MQKILRRVATAERVVAKRKAATDRMHWKKDLKLQKREQLSQGASVEQDIDAAKQAIKDDWNLGPMSPNIYYGEAAAAYGAISETRYRQATKLREKHKEARCAWLGGSKNLNLALGDRVVLLEGPDKGKIGKVTDIQLDDGCVLVEGLNKACSPAPSPPPSGPETTVTTNRLRSVVQHQAPLGILVRYDSSRPQHRAPHPHLRRPPGPPHRGPQDRRNARCHN